MLTLARGVPEALAAVSNSRLGSTANREKRKASSVFKTMLRLELDLIPLGFYILRLWFALAFTASNPLIPRARTALVSVR